jgi:hypothetical protein
MCSHKVMGAVLLFLVTKDLHDGSISPPNFNGMESRPLG